MTSGSVLVVCTGNICRSPVGEALLAHDLVNAGISVTSAGTRAVVGSPPAREALAYIREISGEEGQREAVQLTKESAETADLILTMTAEQRAWTTRLAPRTVRRTYTLLEFARVLAELDRGTTYTTLSELVRDCASQRRKANANGATNDIADPYGGPPEGYASSFALVAEASRQIATTVSDCIQGAAR